MNCYDALAAIYDALTGDVEYEKRADFLEKLFARSRIPVHTVLDLACGSGSLSLELAARGCDVIGVDGSADMLAVAREKAADEGQDILFLCQFFHPEYIGINVRFTAFGNKYHEFLFLAEFKLENDSVEEIEKIIKEEMTRRKNEFSNVINALNECFN